GGAKAADITNKITFMLAKDNTAFSTVEKEGFCTLMKTLAPLYKIPCRKTITRCLEEKYETLTIDTWTEPLNRISYLGLTVHFLMENEHKSVTIDLTSEWNIRSENIAFIVSNNAANIKKAIIDGF
ncbi:uncharacterized protein, partial [Mycetomoellerius zeteki]|uniref:uncharacterized protein n=1 Tax=Mycetomoellerius zeteki TaxID=64791 RepID=UPI00084EBABB